MTAELDAMLEALADPTRRGIFERVVVRPRRVGELADGSSVTRPAVSHHVRILREAGLVYTEEGRLRANVDALPRLRTYFDRLWLEATLGDDWLLQRRIEILDAGL